MIASFDLDYTGTTYGIAALIIFCLAYLMVVTEDLIKLRKSKPVVIAAGLVWINVALVFADLKGAELKAHYEHHGWIPPDKLDEVGHYVERLVLHHVGDFAQLFLFLMVPLPGKIHNLISGPLQTHATTGAVYWLELLGNTVTREGNVMVLNGTVPIAVAEACSGLRMLTAFVVVGSVLAYSIRRPRWQKAMLVISTVPIAIACNLVRLVTTAMLFLHVGSEAAERFFHDFAGVTMMPLAIALLLAELWIFSRLVLPEEQPAPAPA